MNITIRSMTQADIHSVQQIARVSWNNTYEGIIPLNIQNQFLNSAYSELAMEKRLKETVMLVAEYKGNTVGFLNLSHVNKMGQAELIAIYIHPEYQGKGIGTALLQKGIDLFHPNIKEIMVNVEKENTIGLTFYKAKGFKVLNEFDDVFNGHVLKTIRMILTF